MAREDKKSKVSWPKDEVPTGSANKSKADIIRASNLPEDKKLEYLAQIGEEKKALDPNKIPFSVYVMICGVPSSLHQAMLVYPKARGIKLATREEWDEIFKTF